MQNRTRCAARDRRADGLRCNLAASVMLSVSVGRHSTMPSRIFTFLSLSLIGLTLSLLVRLPAVF